MLSHGTVWPRRCHVVVAQDGQGGAEGSTPERGFRTRTWTMPVPDEEVGRAMGPVTHAGTLILTGNKQQNVCVPAGGPGDQKGSRLAGCKTWWVISSRSSTWDERAETESERSTSKGQGSRNVRVCATWVLEYIVPYLGTFQCKCRLAHNRNGKGRTGRQARQGRTGSRLLHLISSSMGPLVSHPNPDLASRFLACTRHVS